MRKIFAIALALVLCAGFAACADGTLSYAGRCIDVPDYSSIEDAVTHYLGALGLENVEIYDSSELTSDILETRIGTTIVERCIGLVTDAGNGDGVILNSADLGDYIGYRAVNLPFQDGMIVLSYMIYNPENDYVDDIIDRYDFILDM